MSEKRRGLGRGLGALIPSGTASVTRPTGDRPVDVFFPDRDGEGPVSGSAAGERALASSVVSGVATVGPANVPVGGVPGRGLGASSTAVRPTFPTSPSARQQGISGANGAQQPAARLAPPSPGVPTPSSPAPARPPAPTGPPAPTVPAPPAPAPVSENGASVDGKVGGRAPSVDQPRADRLGDGETDLVPVPGAYFDELPVAAIRPNPKQPRQVFDEESLAELVQSVKEIGVLQPVVVRRVQDSEGGDAQFELIMGERRLRACRDAGLERIPAIVRDTQDDALLRDALLENLHRSQLNPLEEAAAYQQLLDDFGCTHEDLATRIGRSRPQISNTLRLLKLPPLVQRRVAATVLSAGHARALLGLEDPAAMERLAQRIVAEGLSVRAVEEIVALGDGPVAKTAKRRPRAGTHTSELNDLAARLGDQLDTKVAIALGRNKGRVSIEFASVEDLNRIIGLLSLEMRGAFHQN